MTSKFIAMVAVMLLTASIAGCGVVEVRAVKCDVTGNHPHESKGSPGYIVSKGRVTCNGNGKVTSVRSSILIQKKRNGKWKSIAKSRNTRHIPRAVLGKRYTTQNKKLKCKNGTYRTGVKLKAKVDGKAFSFGGGKWNFGPGVSIKCK